MNLELTDAKRYELEKDNVINLILAANRLGHKINETYIAQVLGIDAATTSKLTTKLKTDNIIK